MGNFAENLNLGNHFRSPPPPDLSKRWADTNVVKKKQLATLEKKIPKYQQPIQFEDEYSHQSSSSWSV